MQETLILDATGLTNTFSQTVEHLQLTDKQQYRLRQIDSDELDVQINIQFTSPVLIVNNPQITINNITYTLPFTGEWNDYPAYAAQLALVMSQAQPIQFTSDAQQAVHNRTLSLHSTAGTVISTSDYHLSLVTGMKLNTNYTFNQTGTLIIQRKMWLGYFRELQIHCPQIKNPYTTNGKDDQYLIIRRQYDFDSAHMVTVQNQFPIIMATEQVCNGLTFIFTNEDKSQFIDFEGEPYRVFATFTSSQQATARKKANLQIQREVRKQLNRAREQEEKKFQEFQSVIQRKQNAIDNVQTERYKELNKLYKVQQDMIKQQQQSSFKDAIELERHLNTINGKIESLQQDYKQTEMDLTKVRQQLFNDQITIEQAVGKLDDITTKINEQLVDQETFTKDIIALDNRMASMEGDLSQKIKDLTIQQLIINEEHQKIEDEKEMAEKYHEIEQQRLKDPDMALQIAEKLPIDDTKPFTDQSTFPPTD